MSVAPRLSLLPRAAFSLFIPLETLGDDTGRASTGSGADTGKLLGSVDEVTERSLGVKVVLSIGRLILFEIEPQRGPHGSGSAKPQDDARTIGKTNANALFCAGRAIHGVVVGEIVGIG